MATSDTGAQVVARDTLAPAPESVRRARRFVTDALTRAGAAEHVDVATLSPPGRCGPR